MPVLLAAFLAHPTTLFALANLKRDLGKLWAWLCHRSFWQLMFGAALIIAGWEYIGKRAEHRHATKVETQLRREIASHEADRAAYVKAQTDAAAANRLQVAAKEAQSRKVSDDERQAYLRDLAQLRADDQRLRSKAAQRPSGPANPPEAPAPAAGADGADKLPLPPEELLRAQEIELQLMYLQSWVRAEMGIDPNN